MSSRVTIYRLDVLLEKFNEWKTYIQIQVEEPWDGETHPASSRACEASGWSQL